LKLRAVLICVLSLVIVVAAMRSFVASAQEDSTSGKPGVTKGATGRQVFVMRRNAQGQVTCRNATPEELLQFSNLHGDSHVIYAGAPRRDATGAKEWTPSGPLGAQLPKLQTSAGLRIVLHATSQLNQNTTAKNAFIAAANHWEGIITTPITVVLDVDFGTTDFGEAFDADVLGATGTEEDTRPFTEVRDRLLANSPTPAEAQLYNALPTGLSVPTQLSNNPFTSLTIRLSRANSRALGFVSDITDPNAIPLLGGDANIGFNSAFPFDFNPGNGVDSDKIDFDSVATHEIGHALGFLSESGGAVYAPPSIWDLFRFRRSES
jgi:hypothetical protein